MCNDWSETSRVWREKTWNQWIVQEAAESITGCSEPTCGSSPWITGQPLPSAGGVWVSRRVCSPCQTGLQAAVLLFSAAQLCSLPRHATDAAAESCVIWISDTLILPSCSMYRRYRSDVCRAVSAGLELLVHKQTHDRPDAADRRDTWTESYVKTFWCRQRRFPLSAGCATDVYLCSFSCLFVDDVDIECHIRLYPRWMRYLRQSGENFHEEELMICTKFRSALLHWWFLAHLAGHQGNPCVISWWWWPLYSQILTHVSCVRKSDIQGAICSFWK